MAPEGTLITTWVAQTTGVRVRVAVGVKVEVLVGVKVAVLVGIGAGIIGLLLLILQDWIPIKKPKPAKNVEI